MAVLLVRHAVAVARDGWDGDDDGRPLTDRGRRQAAGLVEHLAPYGPVVVRSSPSVRCIDTVAPLAAAAGLDVEPADDLAEGNGRAAAGLVRSLVHAPGAVVLCTHGDVIPDVLVALDKDGARLGDEGRCAKGSTWVLDLDGHGRVRGRYLPPPA